MGNRYAVLALLDCPIRRDVISHSLKFFSSKVNELGVS